MRFAATFAILILAQQSGCDSSSPKPVAQSPVKPTSLPKPPLHRFTITRDLDVAFDTQTGQLCKTWDWQAGGKPPAPDPTTGTQPQRTIGEFAPMCLALYEKYSSGSSDEPIIESQSPP
jgi:hypothetical protein